MATNKYATVGAHQLNKYLWSKLQALKIGTDFVFGDYAPNGSINLVPIIPSHEEPEFNNIPGGAPFIVYSYTLSRYGTEWYICQENCTYSIYDANEDRLRTIQNYMVDLLRRYDLTAAEVNKFLGTSTFDFKWVSVGVGTGPDHYRESGGRQIATISTTYQYTHDQDNSGLRI